MHSIENQTRVHVAREFFTPDISVYVRQKHFVGHRVAAVSLAQLSWCQIKEGESIEHRPTFRLSVEEAQHLIDGLWDAGLRPTAGTGSAGALAATQRHLEDMRRLVLRDKYQPQTQS